MLKSHLKVQPKGKGKVEGKAESRESPVFLSLTGADSSKSFEQVKGFLQRSVSDR